MPQDKIDASHFSRDICDFIRLLHKYQVRYVIVGGEAVIYYGHARLTGDIDFFYELSRKNVDNLYQALKEFWSGNIPGIKKADELLEKGLILQFGRPPNRIDLINQIEGISFENAWQSRETVELESKEKAIPVYYLGLKNLIRNKEKLNRPKDIDDLRFLRAIQDKRR